MVACACHTIHIFAIVIPAGLTLGCCCCHYFATRRAYSSVSPQRSRAITTAPTIEPSMNRSNHKELVLVINPGPMDEHTLQIGIPCQTQYKRMIM